MASPGDKAVLWLAQGFGAGRIPVAPGTFGSVAGLGWLALTMAPRNVPLFVLLNAAAIVVSIWSAGRAEQILGARDPGSVVIDEIIAIPISFAGWFFLAGGIPPLAALLSQWPVTLALFAAFRLFDIWKPFPIRQSQRLPGGWGVTIDDLLAGLAVSALTILAAQIPTIRAWLTAGN